MKRLCAYRFGGICRWPLLKDTAYSALATSSSFATDMIISDRPWRIKLYKGFGVNQAMENHNIGRYIKLIRSLSPGHKGISADNGLLLQFCLDGVIELCLELRPIKILVSRPRRIPTFSRLPLYNPQPIGPRREHCQEISNCIMMKRVIRRRKPVLSESQWRMGFLRTLFLCNALAEIAIV